MHDNAPLLRGLDGIVRYRQQLAQQDQLTSAVADALDNAVRIRQDYDQVYYLAGALTGMSEDTKHRYQLVSQLMSQHFQKPSARMFGYAPHLHGTDPVRHPDVTPQEVRNIDFLFASIVPDQHINFLHPVAHGNAIEAGWAESAGIRSVYLAPHDQRLSRLMLGMGNIVNIIRYTDFRQDGMDKLRTELVSSERLLLTGQSGYK